MSFSTRQLLILLAYVGVGLTALSNIDYPFFAAIVEWIVIGTLLSSIYRSWVDKREARVFHASFVICGALYLIVIGIIAHRLRFQGPPDIFSPLRHLLLPIGISYIPWVSATFERAAHFLAALVVGLFGGWLMVFYCHGRMRISHRGG